MFIDFLHSKPGHRCDSSEYNLMTGDLAKWLGRRISMNEKWRTRITIEPGKRSGRPCIRGMRITVYDVLSYLAAGMTVAEVLDDFPYLEMDDIQACFAFAAERERNMLVAVS